MHLSIYIVEIIRQHVFMEWGQMSSQFISWKPARFAFETGAQLTTADFPTIDDSECAHAVEAMTGTDLEADTALALTIPPILFDVFLAIIEQEGGVVTSLCVLWMCSPGHRDAR